MPLYYPIPYPIAIGGTAGSTKTVGFDNLSPTTTRGDLITRDASNNVRVAIGTIGKYLLTNGTDPSWNYLAYGFLNNYGFFTSNNSSSNQARFDGMFNGPSNSGTLSIVNTTDGSEVNFASTASTSSNAGACGLGANTQIFNNKVLMIMKFRLNTTTNVRMFLGWTDNTSMATNLGADDVAATNMVGLQFSTNRSDTNFQFMVDNNSTQTLTSTGVAVDTNAHYLVIDCTATNSVTMTLYNSSFVSQGTTTQTTNLPTSTVAFTPCFGAQTLTNSAANLRLIVGYTQARVV